MNRIFYPLCLTLLTMLPIHGKAQDLDPSKPVEADLLLSPPAGKPNSLSEDVDQLQDQLRQASPEELPQLTSQLRDALGKQYDQRMQHYETTLKQLSDRVETMQQELGRRKAARNELIELRLRTLIAEANQWSWPEASSGDKAIVPSTTGTGSRFPRMNQALDNPTLEPVPANPGKPMVSQSDLSDQLARARQELLAWNRAALAARKSLGRVPKPHELRDAYDDEGKRLPMVDPWGNAYQMEEIQRMESSLSPDGKTVLRQVIVIQGVSYGPDRLPHSADDIRIHDDRPVYRNPAVGLAKEPTMEERQALQEKINPQMIKAFETGQRWYRQHLRLPSPGELTRTGIATVDPWGHPYRLRVVERKSDRSEEDLYGNADHLLQVCCAGPDQIFDTLDDLTFAGALETVPDQEARRALSLVYQAFREIERQTGQFPDLEKEPWWEALAPALDRIDPVGHLREYRQRLFWISSSARSFADITDGTSNTLAFVVLPFGIMNSNGRQGVATARTLTTAHLQLTGDQLIHAIHYDGHLRWIPGNVLPSDLQVWSTIDAGDRVAGQRATEFRVIEDRVIEDPNQPTSDSEGPGASVRPEVEVANQLRQLMLAVHNYHDSHASLPFHPGEQEDLEMAGWRVKLLPYVGQAKLAQQIQIWGNQLPVGADDVEDGKVPVRRWPEQAPDIFQSRSETTVCWVESDARKFADVTDGLSNTIALMAVPNSLLADAPTWTQAGGLNPEQVVEIVARLPDDQSLWVAYYDGSVHQIRGDIDTGLLRAQLTADGRERLELL